MCHRMCCELFALSFYLISFQEQNDGNNFLISHSTPLGNLTQKQEAQTDASDQSSVPRGKAETDP